MMNHEYRIVKLLRELREKIEEFDIDVSCIYVGIDEGFDQSFSSISITSNNVHTCHVGLGGKAYLNIEYNEG